MHALQGGRNDEDGKVKVKVKVEMNDEDKIYLAVINYKLSMVCNIYGVVNSLSIYDTVSVT